MDVKKDPAHLLFTDRELWLITIYAELAGILDKEHEQHLSFPNLSDANKERLRRDINTLLHFFSSRISIYHNPGSRLGNVDLADLDRGYWKYYSDNRYAGYEKSEKPMECIPSARDSNKFELKVNVAADTIPIRQDIGWDISHARRLVHALDALDRNRKAMENIFGIHDQIIPLKSLDSAFANSLAAVVWNGDSLKPLFTNYWCGANGWYRVAYENGTGQCREGDPPYGLTDSFCIGGYSAWARFRPIIGELGKRLYELESSADQESSDFMANYYRKISKGFPERGRNLNNFMFLPSLVKVGI